MPNGQIAVSFPALQNAAANIKSAHAKMDSELNDLESKLAPLTASWTGNAQESYQALHTQWKQAAGDLAQVLASIGTAVSNAEQAYSEGERANAARFSN